MRNKGEFFWYARDVSAFERKTKHLTLTEVGAYDRILDAYYLARGTLSANAEHLHRVCRAIAPVEQAAVAKVVSEFFTVEGGMLRQSRADEEIKKAFAISDKRREAALKSHAKARPKAPPKAPANAGANAGANGGAIGATPYTLHKGTTDTSLREVSAADAAKLTKDEVWRFGREMLATQGVEGKQAGGYLAHLIKKHGEEQVLAALRDAAHHQPADLKSWLVGVLQPKPATRTAARAAIGKALEGGSDGTEARDITGESQRIPEAGDGRALPQAG